MSRTGKVLGGWSATVLVAAVAIALMIANWNGGRSFIPHPLVSIGFASVGALIMSKRPHRIGLLFMGFGAFTALVGFMFQVCPAIDLGPPDGWQAVCGDESRLGAALWPAGFLFFGALFLLFPTGSLPSRRWMPLAVVFLGSWGMLVVGNLAVGERWMEEYLGFLIPVAVWSLAFVALSPLFRIRKAPPVERQQLRWLTYVITMTMFLILVGVVLDVSGFEGDHVVLTILITANAVVGVPAAITIAILRYRLYDIDVVINRTLVYGALTLTLAALYLGFVLGFRSVLSPVTGQSDLAVAASTLLVASLFRPLRKILQNFIDRRFYRRKYDADLAIESFSRRLRDEVELDAIHQDLLSVLAETVQPSAASLWVPPTRSAITS